MYEQLQQNIGYFLNPRKKKNRFQYLNYLLSAGAILLVRVPATIMRSACRGLALNKSPCRSKSYLGAPVCIISTAQQASPKVMGQRDPRLAQFTKSSTFVMTYSNPLDIPAGGVSPVFVTGAVVGKARLFVWRRNKFWVESRARREVLLITGPIVFDK